MSPRRLLLVLAALCGFFVGPALAQSDPVRDDVLANVERCAGITDNRVWLNCFYGAAQPMRAQLGLPAAPESQVALAKNPPVPPPPVKKDNSGWLGIGSLNPFGGSSDEDDFKTGATRLT